MTGCLQSFRAGTGLLVAQAGVLVVSVRIEGLFELKQRWARKLFALSFARPGRVKVTFGAGVRFAPDVEPEEVVRELEWRVAGLSYSMSD